MNKESMREEEQITQINQVISDYFEQSTKADSIAVKELMPYFINAGIFPKDIKKGKPIRDVLRTLDKQNDLAKIPFLHPERKEKNTFWYFVRPGSTYVSDAPNDTGVRKRKKIRTTLANSDEHYVINLCDELLHEKASRQHKFDFLLSDYHKDGTRTSLPVDAYYREKNLVIELVKNQQNEATDNLERKTRGEINRAEQRKKYDERRKKGLLAKSYQLMEVDYSVFEFDTQGKLIRNEEKDLKVVSELLKDFNEELWRSL